MAFKISHSVRVKLNTKHDVAEDSIEECFANRQRGFLEDVRVRHKTTPPTLWFISVTDRGKKLKIVFIKELDGDITIKSAFSPNCEEERIYNKYALSM